MIRPPLLALIAALALAAPFATAAPVVGQPAPPLIGTSLTGAPVNLAAFRGRVVVVNLWATWCAPCREEMPALDAFSHRYAGRGVVVLGLSADAPQAALMAERVTSALSYPNLMLTQARVNGFGAPRLLPVTVIIGPDGVVRAIVNGEGGLLTEQRLAALVEPLLPRTSQPL